MATSGPARGWLPALARRIASVTGTLNPPASRVSRFPGSRNMASGSGVEGEGLGIPYRRRFIPFANDPIHTTKDNIISMDKHLPITQGKDSAATKEFISCYGHCRPTTYGDEDASRTAVEVTGGKQDPRGAVQNLIDGEVAVQELIDGEEIARNQRASEVSDNDGYEEFNDRAVNYHCDCHVWTPLIASSHRDGSIYDTRGTFGSGWKWDYRIADRNETRLEAMMLSHPTKDCYMRDGTCIWHPANSMLQIFSVKLAKTPVVDGSIELYGYIAVRDLQDPLLNYIVKIGRDDPIIVEQGSLIEMTGPKRGIDFSCAVLVEYDMRIKTGEREEDDLQLIDGATDLDHILTSHVPVRNRIYGDCGAVDITQANLLYAFEATVEVVISEVQTSFDLCLSCFTSGLHEEIRLFDGAISESRDLRRYVIAVMEHECMDLKFKVGLGSGCFAEHCRSFKATNHGCASEQIKIEFASISVKVTWSAMEF
ncbi:uncharacterized protein [Oryza sativa Japonica Group]|uniref:OSIGBa0093K19.10 protein n=1 Tax=Oryza sativa TaxID=4530 RepID=Q01K98_ORYSA|nr:hypothetical protein EE612_023688 [Oryza sativa]KAB8095569.1 hypothetical protein EE612_023688 [Oryza sativa]KAF2934280.1 hypothetical protein DAI22_04g151500 [Oryza sativa Japonica Group]CAH66823.1 OSIGBa0093K19.10 [Oryza sativa]